MSQEREFLTAEQAIAMLPRGATVNVKTNPAPGAIIGADWRRTKVEELIRKGKPELSGELATSMGFGLAVDVGGDFHFIQTRA